MLIVSSERQQIAHYYDATGERHTISIHSPNIVGPHTFNFLCVHCNGLMTAIRYSHDPESSYFFHLKCEPVNV